METAISTQFVLSLLAVTTFCAVEAEVSNYAREFMWCLAEKSSCRRSGGGGLGARTLGLTLFCKPGRRIPSKLIKLEDCGCDLATASVTSSERALCSVRMERAGRSCSAACVRHSISLPVRGQPSEARVDSSRRHHLPHPSVLTGVRDYSRRRKSPEYCES